MRLLVTTPLAVVADHADIVSVRAQDASGWFGVLPGHTDLLTVLLPSVLSWRHADGHRRHCAVRGGVLTVRGGRTVAVATRQAVPGENLDALGQAVLGRFHAELDAERAARVESLRLHMQAIRRIVQVLRPGAADRPGT